MPERSSASRFPIFGPTGRLMLSLALAYCAIGIVLSVLPIHLRHTLGASNTEVGAVVGVAALVAFVARPFAGGLSERHGYRRMMALGAVLIACANALYLHPSAVAVLGAARLLTGAGDALVLTAAGAWVLALATPERRGRTIALFGLALWTGFTLGPLVGDVLARHGGLAAAGLGGVILAAASVATALSLGATEAAASGDRSVPLFPRAVLRPGAAFALAAFGYAAHSTFASLHFVERGWGGGARPLVAFGIGFLLSRGLGAGLPDRFGSVPVAIGAGLVEACGLLLFAVAGSPLVALAGAFLIGAGFALAYPAFALIAIDAVPPSHRGATLGAFTSFWDVAIAVGAPLSGALTTWGGKSAPFVAAAICSIAATIFAGMLGTAARRAGATRRSAESSASGRSPDRAA